MKTTKHTYRLLLGLIAPLAAAADITPLRTNSVPNQPAMLSINVMTVRLGPSNQVYHGTNVYRPGQFTNLLASTTSRVDAIAVRTPPRTGGATNTQSAVLQRLFRLGLPLLVEEEEGNVALRKPETEEDVQSLTVSSDWLAKLRGTRAGAGPARDPRLSPVITSTVERDNTTGEYDLKRVELGLPGRRLWLIHEREEDSEKSMTGVQLKRNW